MHLGCNILLFLGTYYYLSFYYLNDHSLWKIAQKKSTDFPDTSATNCYPNPLITFQFCHLRLTFANFPFLCLHLAVIFVANSLPLIISRSWLSDVWIALTLKKLDCIWSRGPFLFTRTWSWSLLRVKCWLIRVSKVSVDKHCCHALLVNLAKYLRCLCNNNQCTSPVLNWIAIFMYLQEHSTLGGRTGCGRTTTDWCSSTERLRFKQRKANEWPGILNLHFPVWIFAPHFLPSSWHKATTKGNAAFTYIKCCIVLSCFDHWSGVGEERRQRSVDCETSCNGSRLWHKGESLWSIYQIFNKFFKLSSFSLSGGE